MATKFSLEKAVGGKRPASENISPQQSVKKIPKVSQMQPAEPRPQRATTNAPVVICAYPVTDCAGDLWAQYKDSNEQLWQIQVDHDARPSISVNIRRSLEEYLKEAGQDEIDTIQKLQTTGGIKLTMTGKDDTDSLGCFVQYRIAFYVAGAMSALENFFMLFDGYMQYKAKQFARATPFEVHIHPYSGVDLSGLEEQMAYRPIEFIEPAKELPLKWFEAHPVIGNKILCFHFEPEDENTLHLVITGNTWLYRDDLEKHGVLGSRGEGGEAYFRYDQISFAASHWGGFSSKSSFVMCVPRP